MEFLEITRKEALQQVIAHLEYQRLNYEKLPPEQRKGHIWQAVLVLQKELAQELKRVPIVEQIRQRQIRSSIRKVDERVQGY